jgi:hypothetical protein
MLSRTRASRSPDTSRLASALSTPGIDPRLWTSLAIVAKDPVLDPEHGYFVDVVLLPSQQPETARIACEYEGPHFGLFMPLEKDDEVLVEAPSGNPDEGLIVTKRLWSASDPPPTEAVDNPHDVVLVVKKDRNVRLYTSGEGNLVIVPKGTGKVLLGAEDASKAVTRVGDAVNIGSLTVTQIPATPAGVVIVFTYTPPGGGLPHVTNLTILGAVTGTGGGSIPLAGLAAEGAPKVNA